MVKELRSSDLEKLGLSRGLSFFNSDDLKQARAIKHNAKKQGRNIDIYKNGDGEIAIGENGKIYGTLNKKGLSRADAVNLVADPINATFLIPGIGEASMALKAGSSLAKAAKAGGMLGKVAKITSKVAPTVERSAKLGSAVGTTDLANSVVANKEGGKNALLDGDITHAVTTGATAPLLNAFGQKLVRSFSKKPSPKKITPKDSPEKVTTEDLPKITFFEEQGVPLTKGQFLGNKADLEFETRVAKGELGEKAQKVLDNFKIKQLEKFKDNVITDLPVIFDDPSVNVKLADELQDIGREAKISSKEAVQDAYNQVDQTGAGLSRANVKELLDDLENSLDFDARDAVSSFDKDVPEFAAVNVVNKLKHGFSGPDQLAKRLALKGNKDYESFSKGLNQLINTKDDDIINLSKNTFRRDYPHLKNLLDQKGFNRKMYNALLRAKEDELFKNINPKNLKDVFKHEKGDVDIKFNDGSLNNLQYGTYNSMFDRGFAGKKIESKHPNVATSNLKQKLKNSKLLETKENGRRLYQTPEGELVVVTPDNKILSVYRKKLGADSQTFWEPSTYDVTFQSQTPNSKSVPKKQELSNRLYDVISIKKLEQGRRVINKALDAAVKHEDNASVANLMKIKDAFDDTFKRFIEQGRIEGNSTAAEDLLHARDLEAIWNKKFTNTKHDEFGKRVEDFGAKEILDLINNANKGGEDFARLFALSNQTKQLGAIKKAREIFGNSVDNTLKQIYLNSVFTDLGRIGGKGELNIKQTIKNIQEKVEKNNKVAKELLAPHEFNQIISYKKLLEKIDKKYDPNPSGTASKVLRDGALALSGMKIPLAKQIKDIITEQIFNTYRIEKHLKPTIMKKQAEAVKHNKLGTFIGSLLNPQYEGNND